MGTIPAWLQSQPIKLAFVFRLRLTGGRGRPRDNQQTRACARGSVICPPVMINNKDDKLAIQSPKAVAGLSSSRLRPRFAGYWSNVGPETCWWCARSPIPPVDFFFFIFFFFLILRHCLWMKAKTEIKYADRQMDQQRFKPLRNSITSLPQNKSWLNKRCSRAGRGAGVCIFKLRSCHQRPS